MIFTNLFLGKTLKSFDILDHFLKTEMIGRIPVTRLTFEDPKEEIEKAINLLK